MSAVAETNLITTPEQATNRDEIRQYIRFRHTTYTRFLRKCGVSENRIPAMQFVFSRLFDTEHPRLACHPASNVYKAREILLAAGFSEQAIGLLVYKKMHRGSVRG